MLSPSIREDLGRLREGELAREAERRGRLVAAPQARSARRAISLLLAPLHRRSIPPTGTQLHDVLDDEPFVFASRPRRS